MTEARSAERAEARAREYGIQTIRTRMGEIEKELRALQSRLDAAERKARAEDSAYRAAFSAVEEAQTRYNERLDGFPEYAACKQELDRLTALDPAGNVSAVSDEAMIEAGHKLSEAEARAVAADAAVRELGARLAEARRQFGAVQSQVEPLNKLRGQISDLKERYRTLKARVMDLEKKG